MTSSNLNGATSDPAERVHVLILRAAGERIAFQVDEILSEQEVLAKPFAALAFTGTQPGRGKPFPARARRCRL